MKKYTKISEVIGDISTGIAIYYRQKFNDKMKWETVIGIREESYRIRTIPKKPGITLRAGLLNTPEYPNIYIGVTLFSFKKVKYGLYELWWNFHLTGVRKNFDAIVNQDRLFFEFWGDSIKVERRIVTDNLLLYTFKQWLSVLSNTTPWKVDDFNKAKKHIYSRYPTVQHLWKGLPT